LDRSEMAVVHMASRTSRRKGSAVEEASRHAYMLPLFFVLTIPAQPHC
jgi:hypothetical protein